MRHDNPSENPERPGDPGVFRSATGPVRLASMVWYASPVAASYLLFMPIGIVLQGIYATEFGLALTAIAGVFFVARIFDAVSDPIIGYLSDWARAKGISRKWWVASGGILLLICSYYLYIPPPNVSVGYFMFWSLAFYFAWTVLDVSHLAWGSELTREADGRLRIFNVRAAMVYTGAIAFYVLPILPLFDTREFTPTTLKYAVIIAGVMMIPALLAATRFVPNGEFVSSKRRDSIGALLRMTATNKPFLVYVAIYVLTGIGGGIWISLTFVVFNSYYGIGEYIAILYSMGSVVGLIGLPVWFRLGRRIGKRNTWFVAQSINVVCFSIPMFVVPGEGALAPLLISTVGIFFSEGCRLGVLPSLLADIIDYGTWKYGTDRAATYFSLNTLMQKISIGVGAGGGLLLLGLLGFDPTTVTPGGEGARFAVVISFCLLPTAVILMSLALLTQMRLSERHAAIIKCRLEGRLQ